MSTLTRAAFGMRGDLPNVVLSLGGLGGVQGDQYYLWRRRVAGAFQTAPLDRPRRCRKMAGHSAAAAAAVLIVWVGPSGGVWICDGYLRRGKLNFHAIHSRAGPAGRYWGWHGLNQPGCIALLTGMTAAALTMKSPLYDGPIALALGGTDLSWLVGVPVSALVYAGLTLLGERRRAHALGLAAD